MTTLVAAVVAGYGLSMVLAAPLTGGLFEALGFGMRQAGITEGAGRDYVLFLYGVLGAVIVGWMVLIVAVLNGAFLARGSSGSGFCVALSLGAWFVVDTGFSIVVAQWQHALFNVAFLVALGLPLLVCLRHDRGVATRAPVDSH
ncbi:hypothetical protein [Nocardioides sp.]|uniref:hypothetical protein n=1 Tax=Nocardioides sp. TaxID=35761 RepID=UPI002D0936A9|nr:hypothetical protein [Nocardioides sp.]HXH77029.1 hypothetical protein [Nocardioides sp.]